MAKSLFNDDGIFAGDYSTLISLSSIGSTSPEIGSPVGEDDLFFVNDIGLLVDVDDDVLNEEFTKQLGSVTEVDHDLSQVFKSSYSISDFEEGKLQTLQTDKQEIISKYRFVNYARLHFQNGHVPNCMDKQIPHPLLPKQDSLSFQASINLWIAIHRFLGSSHPDQDPSKRASHEPIMTQICNLFDPAGKNNSKKNILSRDSSEARDRIQDGTKSRKSSLRQLKEIISSAIGGKTKFSRMKSRDSGISISGVGSSARGSSESSARDSATLSIEETSETREDKIPYSDLDIVHYIIAHGIIRPELRDEIFCQLCCHVVGNPSAERVQKGWLLHSLCSGCFLPSSELINHYYAFLHDAPSSVSEHKDFVMQTLARTNLNGLRYHPPNWNEYLAVVERRKMGLQICLPDDRLLPIEVDSASTSSEICEGVATALSLKDSFGFSLYVSINNQAGSKVSSLGCGQDHIMDAITECEQLIRKEGKSEQEAPWKVYYRKELFTPWHDASHDIIYTDLIYNQITDGIRRDEYTIPALDELGTFVAKCMYAEYGSLKQDAIRKWLPDYVPRQLLKDSKSLEKLSKSVFKEFQRLQLGRKITSKDKIKAEIVSSASLLWPIHFSAMFEAFRYQGPQRPLINVVIAVNGDGVFVLDSNNFVIMIFHYYDFITVIHNGCPDPRRSTVRLYTIDGSQFTFFSPNAETLSKMIQAFLDGLRRRSEWGLATQDFILQEVNAADNEGDHLIHKGDLLQLLRMQDSAQYPGWSYGRCDRSGTTGIFPNETVYILPTIKKPADDFIRMVKGLNQKLLSCLPRRPTEILLTRFQSSGQYAEESFA